MSGDRQRPLAYAGALMKELPLALTFDDVLLVPRRSRIRSRADVATRTQLTRRIALEIPVVSANMDTVTTAPMAIALAQLGGIGVLHRFLSVEDEVAEVARVKRFRTRVIADPHTIEAGATLARARAEVERLGVSGLLVVDGDGRLAGILTARDLRAGDDPAAAVAAHMTPLDRLVTGPPGITPAEALALLHHHRIEKLPLADAEGRVAGMVTLRDLAAGGALPARDARRRGSPAGGGRDRRARRLPGARRGAARGRCRRARARHRARPRRIRAGRRARAEAPLPRGRRDRRQRRDRRGRARPRGRRAPMPSRSASGPASRAPPGSSPASAYRSSPPCWSARRRRARPACR